MSTVSSQTRKTSGKHFHLHRYVYPIIRINREKVFLISSDLKQRSICCNKSTRSYDGPHHRLGFVEFSSRIYTNLYLLAELLMLDDSKKQKCF